MARQAHACFELEAEIKALYMQARPVGLDPSVLPRARLLPLLLTADCLLDATYCSGCASARQTAWRR